MVEATIALIAALLALGAAVFLIATARESYPTRRWPWLLVAFVLIGNATRMGANAVYSYLDRPVPVTANILVGSALLAIVTIGAIGIRRAQPPDGGAEAARRATLRQMRRTMARAPAPIGLVDAEGRYVFVNDAGCAFFRYSREEIIGHTFRDFIADEPGAMGAFERMRREGVASTQRRIRRGDGTTVVVQVDMIALGDGLQLFIAQDITPQMEAQAAARIVEGRLRRAQSVARVGSWEADIPGGNAWWSDELYHLLGLRPGEVPPSEATFMSRVHPEDRALARAGVARTVRSGVRSHSRFRILLPDGRLRSMRQVAEIVERSGQRTRVSGALIDITEELRLREQADQAERFEAVARATAGVAHDFSNLLSVLRNNLALSREMEGEARDQRLQKAEQAADRARELVARLLEFSRSGAQTVRPGDGGPVDLASVAREAAALAREQMPPGAEVLVEAPETAIVTGDADDLHRLCMNLLVNAAEALAGRPPGRRPPRVTVHVRAGEEGALRRPLATLRVSDNGPGMPPAVRDHAFEPFFTTKATQGGSGLGLATVYAIARAHGGSARIEDEPGGGVAIVVRLPLAVPAVPATVAG